MSQFGCYTFDRLFCECGTCEACQHRALIEEEHRTTKFKKRVSNAIDGFMKRVEAGTYVGPDDKREKAKQRVEDKKLRELLTELQAQPELFPKERQ